MTATVMHEGSWHLHSVLDQSPGLRALSDTLSELVESPSEVECRLADVLLVPELGHEAYGLLEERPRALEVARLDGGVAQHEDRSGDTPYVIVLTVDGKSLRRMCRADPVLVVLHSKPRRSVERVPTGGGPVTVVGE